MISAHVCRNYGGKVNPVTEKQPAEVTDKVNPSPCENLTRFNETLSQTIISACYISGRFKILHKASLAKDYRGQPKGRDVRSMLWMLREYPVRTLLALFLTAAACVAWAIIALTHVHIF